MYQLIKTCTEMRIYRTIVKSKNYGLILKIKHQRITFSNFGCGYLFALNFKTSIMKSMTCRQLGGACDQKFQANSFEEMAELSKKHGAEMFQKGDEAHINAMHHMKELMSTPQDMKEWFENKRKEFETLPADQ